MDVALAQQLQPFALLLNIRRDRGAPFPITATHDKTGKQILVLPGGKPALKNPEVNFCNEKGVMRYNITARSEAEAEKIFKQIKNKHPTATIESFKHTEEPVNEPIHFQSNFGGDAFLSLCKTAICYFIYVGGDKAQITGFINKFKKKNIFDVCNFYYPEAPPIKKQKHGITHSVVIVGDSKEKILYAYIELFNFYHAIILLSDNYSGINMNEIYCFDVLMHCEVAADINIELTPETMAVALEKNSSEYFNDIKKEIKSTMRDIEFSRITERAWDKTFELYGQQYPDGIPREIFSRVISELIINEIKPYIRKSGTKS